MKKFIAAVLAVLMLVSLIPMSMIATSAAVVLPDDMTIVEDSESTLAPGITENKMVVYDKDNNRVEMFVAVADTSVDTVGIYANYLDNQNQVYGMQKTTDQVAAFEANHPDHNVVVAINASYFNTSTGKPTGTFVMEGIDVTNTSEGNNYPFFAILNDGTPIIASKGEYSSYKGQIAEAIGGYIHLVKDGAICSGLNKVDKYPRQTIGLTEDGRVILMTADCIAPKSSGLTIQEQAEVMLAMGCVEALHLDGGGSATYCSKAEGSDTLVVTNSPSNGTERTVSNTLIFTSTVVADGTFDHALLTAEDDYVTPGTTTEISAIGVDAAGSAADMPAEGITWQLTDPAMGTVYDGVFTAGSTTGVATIEMVYGGEVVGSVDVNVVLPTSITFGREQIVVPYGQTVDVKLTANYGAIEVKYNDSDVVATLADAGSGTLDGLKITAPDASTGITGTTLNVAFNNTVLTASVAIVYGKGSEVVFDFEDGTPGADTNNWILRTHESTSASYGEQGEIYIVDSETGRVHDGGQALAFNADFSKSVMSGSNTNGYIALSLSWGGEAIDVKGAQKIGFWLYIPEDAMTTEVIVNTVYYDANGVAQRRTTDCYDDNGEYIYTPYWSQNMEGSGWHYVEADFSSYKNDLLIKDEPALSSAYKRNFFIKILCVSGPDSNQFDAYQGDFTYYIDDITVDYSDAVADRELPVISGPYAYGTGIYDKSLSYGVTTDVEENTFVFSANAADNTTKSNYSGINAKTAKVFVDGNEVSATYANGKISSESVTLPAGHHTIRFEIEDNMGNLGYITRTINVLNSDKKTVEFVPHDASLTRLLSGSVYWVDLVSDDIDTLKKAEVTLNVNSINEFEIEHMAVNAGFDVTYTSTAAQDVENIVEVTFTRNNKALDADSNIIASVPVRVWQSRTHENPKHTANTPAYQWSKGKIDPMNLNIKLDKGLAIFADETSFFSNEFTVEHEAYTSYFAMDKDYHASRTYHVHTAEALEDKAATCTETGYTGRTYCEECASVVDWGTTVKATGHNYVVSDGKLSCEACGDSNNLTALYETEDGVYYFINGVAQTGWQFVGDSWYYFDATTFLGAEGSLKLNNITYEFTAGKLNSGVWVTTLHGMRYSYGPEYCKSGWYTIDGKEYFFEKSYCMKAGYQVVVESYTEHNWYYFNEDGSCDRTYVIPDGFYTDRNGYGYSKDGKALLGLQNVDGTYYFFDNYGYAQTGTYYGYLFGEDYKAVTGIVENENGLCYYENGKPRAKGLICIDGDYYFAGGANGELTINAKQYAWETNGYLPADTYEYGADGKMLDGIIEKDGTLYYYETGKATACGLVELDGAYYFVGGANGEIAVDKVQYVWNGNGYLPEANYRFGADGKMLDGIVDIDGTLYYYENGKAKMAGLIELDGAYYFAGGSNGEVAVSRNQYIWMGDEPFYGTNREFGADGKMLDGIVEKADGLYYYVDGKPKTVGLVQVDGDYYFAGGAEGKVITDKVQYIWQGEEPFYGTSRAFGADGKMLDGIVEKADGLYYYVDGQPKTVGLVLVDGAYYFAGGAEGKVITDKKQYVWESNGYMANATREFGEDGKMLNGIVDKDGTLYYYVDGQTSAAGLIEVDGAYYFVGSADGKITTDSTVYVWDGNGIVTESNRTFGADGKMLNGFYEVDGNRYYYYMGQPGKMGLNYIDGYYYFVKDATGLLVTNQTYYAWETNGLSIEMNYTFDSMGRVIL